MSNLLILLVMMSSFAFAQESENYRQARELSQKLQTIFSDPKKKAEYKKEELEELTVIQSKLLNYQRVHQVLKSSNCNIDPKSKNPLATTILSAAETSRSCAVYGTETLSDHQMIESLIDEIQMIEDHHYEGVYTLDKKGNISYPWEWGGKDPKTQLKQISGERITDEQELAELRSDLYKQSLKDTFETFLFLGLKGGAKKVSERKLVDDFCRSGPTPLCPESLKVYLVQMTADAIKKASPPTKDADVSMINQKVVEMNLLFKKLESNARKGREQASLKFAEFQKNNPSMSMKTGPKFKDKDQFFNVLEAQSDYTAYRKLHTQLVSKDPGTLILTDTLRKSYGLKEFSPFAFLKEMPPLKPEKYTKALEEAKGHAADHAQELLINFHSKKPHAEQIEEMIRLNPSAVASVLMREPTRSLRVCGHLKNISIKEMNNRQIQDTVMWGGMIVGGVLTASGIGAIPMSIVGAVTSASDIGFSWTKYKDSELEKNAAFAEGNGERLALAVQENENAQNNLGLSLGLSVAGAIFDAKLILKVKSPANTKLKYFLGHSDDTASIVKRLLKPHEKNSLLTGKIIDQLFAVHVAGGEIGIKITLGQLRAKAKELQRLESLLGLTDPGAIATFRKDIKKMMDSGALGLTSSREDLVLKSLWTNQSDFMNEMKSLYPELLPHQDALFSSLSKKMGEQEMIAYLKKDRALFKSRADALMKKCGR